MDIFQANRLQIKGDKIIWIIVVLLSLFSVLTVFSSTGAYLYSSAPGSKHIVTIIKHSGLLLVGLFIMYLTHRVKYTKFAKYSRLLFLASIVLLVITLFISGGEINDAKRWISIPIINLSFQTSDLAKVALIIYVARLLAKRQDEIQEKSVFQELLIPILIICGLIFPANFSTSALLFGTCFILMFIGRIPLKFLGALAGVFVVLGFVFILIAPHLPDVGRIKTMQSRIENFTNKTSDPDDDYQSDQAKIAIAKGGFLGQTPGGSTQRNFLPNSASDFIFAIICEEYGTWGPLIIIFLYLVLLYRCIVIAKKAEGSFGAFVALGLGFLVVFQALINMGVAVGLGPVTGQPLPLISMGGTSLWFSSISIGIILSVSADIEKREEDAVLYEGEPQSEITENEVTNL